MSKYNKQHILPQFYLKEFWFLNKKNNKEYNIYIWDISKNEVKEKSIKNIWYLNNIFTNYDNYWNISKNIEIEFWKIEGTLSSIIKHIKNNAINAYNKKFENLQLEVNETTILLKLIWFLLKKITLTRILNKKIILSNLGDSYIKSNKEEIFNVLYEEKSDVELIKELAKRNWRIIYTAHENYNFLSSDFPIFWWWKNSWSISLYDHTTPLVFSLTKNIMIYIHWETTNLSQNLEYVYQDEKEHIKILNKAIISNANDYIFWYNKEQVIEALSMIKNWDVFPHNAVKQKLK